MASLDMSLDDMIKNSRNSRRGRGQGRARRGRGAGGSFSGGRMMGPPRRGPLRVNAQQSPYAIAKSFRRPKSFPWQRDLLEDSLRAAGLPGVENGTKLYISNLDTGVTNEDIRELFSEFGQLKRHAVHYDKNGRPNGSAAIVFARRSDAFQALKRYNNVQLDGKPMKIEIIGTNSEIPASARVNVVGGVNGRRTVAMPGGYSRGSAAVSRGSGQRGRGGGFRNGRGRTRWRGRGGRGGRKPVDKSADDLDKELENYHAGAMET
ncbi:THO complex subunit 4D-like [Actinidia eriantha]|uniref:THO complex subunit 4D-like n=1 Tax=Actinidia eriantha TaxID=165200 RepID=UPI002583C191|nr:THO complex subunit 4D-like [Actinidia eriantha]XP_057501009.1 THO complex subunit 4D-like [Actinidia eriantha]XP_057501010.1 THO complex subunit 4D-like [Actinidia eriantha]